MVGYSDFVPGDQVIDFERYLKINDNSIIIRPLPYGVPQIWSTLNFNCRHIHSHTRKHINKTQNKKFQSPATSNFPKSS